MKVLIVEPGYSPYEADLENTLASLTAVLESEQYTAAFPFDNTVIAAVYGGECRKAVQPDAGQHRPCTGTVHRVRQQKGPVCGADAGAGAAVFAASALSGKFEERDGRLYSLPCDPKIKPKDERLGNSGRFSFLER